jgi:hypothetical protein
MNEALFALEDIQKLASQMLSLEVL